MISLDSGICEGFVSTARKYALLKVILLSIALRIPTAHDFCVISARTYSTKELSLKLSSIAKIDVRFLLNEHGDLYFFIT